MYKNKVRIMAESLESAANKSLNEGNYEEAIKFYIQAADAYKLDGSIFLEDAANCYNNAATLYTEMGNFDRAVIYYQKAIDCYLEVEPEINDKKSLFHNIVACCEDIAIAITALDDYESSTKFFTIGLEYLVKILEMEDELIKKYINNQIVLDYSLCALCFLMTGNENKAINFIQQSAKIAHDSESPQEIGALTSIFGIHVIKKNHDEALNILKNKIEPNAPLFSARSTGLQAQIMTLFYNVFHKYFPGEQMYYQTGEEKGIIKIRNTSYLTIALHALFYANRNIPRVDWKEIYGLLIGKIEGDNVYITDAIPITSGSKYEVKFENKHYAKAAEIDGLAASKNLFIIGWYHSHPGIGLFLSHTDIVNHLGYQSVNPKAIALVFDFTDLSENNPGFKIFKLKNLNYGAASGYYTVSWKIEGDTPKYNELTIYMENIINQIVSLCKSEQNLSFEEIAHKLKISKFMVKELLPEIKKRYGLTIIINDSKEEIVSKDQFYRQILNLTREYNPLSIKTMIDILKVDRNIIIEALEDMLSCNMLHGEFKRAKDEFVKS
ncbi:MAG: tetratricopeptide repeat protein [Candidatus Helarchaeota archaeon]